MSDFGTNFPPQTYSSVFNLNTLTEEEKNVNREEGAEGKSGSSPVLDCFASAMFWKYFLVIFLLYLTSSQADKVLTCIMEENPKIRIFETLIQYQANKLSFNPHDETFSGNYVGFSFKTIDRLPKNAFITFTAQSIIEIDLSSKSIQKIDEGAFLYLFCLHYLDLSNNQISNLTTNMFQGVENLRTLNLSRNSLVYLANSVFSNLKSIQTLDISHNNISELESAALFNISTLEKLMLSYNRMKRIRYLQFSQLSQLKELHLDNNYIALVPTMIFSNNTCLETLDLSGNGLVLLDMRNDCTKLPSVKNLNLSDNYLITLHVENISYHFSNTDLTIDFNNNQFYCSGWKQYLKEFKEKHIKITPGRNFSQEYNMDGMACDTLNVSSDGTDSEEDTFALNETMVNILREINHKREELSLNRARYNIVDSAPEISPLVQQGNPPAPSNNKDTSSSDYGTTKGVAISLSVIGMVVLILVTVYYILGVGVIIKVRKRLRYFLSSSSADNNSEYVTLTPSTCYI